MVPRPDDADEWGDPEGVWEDDEEVGPEAESDAEAGPGGAAHGDDDPGEAVGEEADGSVFGPAPGERRPVEPGDPSAENAAFVLLGALVAVGLLLRLLGVL